MTQMYELTLKSIFWALNKNYEEITSGVVEERDIAFVELLKE